MGNSSFFNNPNDYEVVDEGGEGSGFYEGPAYTQIDPVAIANFVAQAAASATSSATSAAASEVSRQLAAAEAANAAASVQAAAGTAAPLMDGTAAVGAGTKWAREDHRHPTDTSRADAAATTSALALKAPLASPDFSGTINFTGTALLLKSAGYTRLYNGDGTVACFLSGGPSDPYNYYRQTVHYFQNQDGSVTWGSISGSGVAFNVAASGPNPSNGDNSTKYATTAWVQTNAPGTPPATVLPIMNGTAAVGVISKYAREDHVHPTDTSRAPLASPALTGTPTAPTQAALMNSTAIATTAYVDRTTRERLTADRTYYVATTGSDSNNGLTVGTPFLTVQKAIDVCASTLDFGGYTVTVSVAAGTYSGQITYKAMVGMASYNGFAIQGAGTTTIFNYAGTVVIASGPNILGTLRNCLVAPGSSHVGVNLSVRSFLNLDGVNFGACVYFMAVSSGAALRIASNWGFQASATVGIFASTNAVVMAEGFGTCTITNSPSFANAFLYAENGAAIRINGNTWSGAATGGKYNITNNSTVFVNGAGDNYLPGTAGNYSKTNGATYA